MDVMLIREAAITLNSALNAYAHQDIDAERLRSSLQPILEDAIEGRLQQPVDWKQVPGDWLFNETNLRKYKDLESAYARFKVQVTGGESAALHALKARMGE